MATTPFTRELRGLVNGYAPSPENLEFAKTLDVVTVSGASCIGKDTVMAATGLYVVSGTTTRQERPDEIANLHFVTTKDEKEQLIEDLRAGNFLRAKIHSTTGKFYGSKPADFSTISVNLMAAMPDEYETFEAQGVFNHVRAAYITAPYGSWLKRLESRETMTPRERAQRMREAKHSLRSALGSDEFYFILNDRAIMDAARNLSRFANSHPESEKPDDDIARAAGKTILHALKNKRETGRLQLDR